MNRPLALACAALLTCAPAVFADRTEVEAVLHQMEAAVLAGDGPAYLTHVADDDAVFLKEQQNWAADLKRSVPTAFTLSILDEGAVDRAADRPAPAEKPVFDADHAAFTLSIHWTTPKRETSDGPTGAGGHTHAVAFPVTFARSKKPDGSAAWLYHGEDWTVISDGPREGFDGVRVCYLEGPLSLERAAKQLVAFTPEVRAGVDKQFDQRIARPLVMKLYTSMEHLQESIYLSYENPLGGWNEPGESIKLLMQGRRAPDKATIAHEYGHVCTFEFGHAVTNAPWWVLEGTAEYVSRPFRPAAVTAMTERMIEALDDQHGLAPWSEITDFRKTPQKYQQLPYAQGESMIAYITQRGGQTARNDFLKALAARKTLDEATQAALKIDFATLDQDWRANLKKVRQEHQAAGDNKPRGSDAKAADTKDAPGKPKP